jgi:hypothetical protein
VARQRNAEESQTDLDSVESEESEQESESGRSAATDALWAEVRIDPVEIALPPGRAGYTLRAYRPVADVAPTEADEPEVDPFAERRRRIEAEADAEEPDALDEEYADEDGYGDGEPAEGDESEDEEVDEDEDEDDEDEPDADEDSDAEAVDEEEEIPVFLSHRGRLLLFASAEGLVEFVRSGAEHDLAQLDTWPDLVERITPEDIVPLAEDAYELDLVVENLRSGHDGWDSELIIKAGEIARDLGYALRIQPVIAALSPGSPLDDLDEALRATTGGGLGRLLARRRLRKFGAEAAPLGWRTIIGKISALVDWRD